MITDLRAADWSTPAVVLKFDQNVLHHGSLGVIRSLGRLGVPVYGVHEGAWAPAASSRYLAGRFFWQPRPDDPQRTLSGLFDLASQIGRRAVLYATDDAGAIFLAEHGDVLREAFAFPRPAADLPRRLAGKYSLFQLCRDLGVPTPQAMLAWSPGEAAAFAGQAGFPLIAKLTTPWRGTAGPRLRSTTIVRTPSELQEICACAHETSTGLMLQEYIPPAPGQDWFFHGYFDTASRCQTAFTGVKDRSYPAYAGLTSLGRAVPNSRLREQVTAMAATIGFRGILDLDLRFDPRDAQYKLLDFNPRLGAQFRLFTTGTGLDVVRAAYLDLTGQPVAAGEMTRDRRFLVENYDPLGAVGYWRRGELGLRSWVASLRRVDEVAWLARDDLRPFGLMCARMAWRGMSRRFRAGKSSATQSSASQSSAGQSGAGQSSARGPSALLRAAGGPRYRPGPRAARAARPVRPGPDAWSHNTEFSNEGERV
jgi:D-aspartate ligase